MPKQTTITIFEVVERKAVTERDPRFYRFTKLEGVPPIFTADGDMLAEFPLSGKIRHVDIPVRSFVRYGNDGNPEKKFVAISPEVEEIFDAFLEGERRSMFANIKAERQAKEDAVRAKEDAYAIIDGFNSLPLFKRIWRAIRKDI